MLHKKMKMNTMKNLTTGLLITAMAIGGSPLASLADGVDQTAMPYGEEIWESQMKFAHYGFFEGTIESIEPHHSIPDAKMIRVHGEGEAIADFVLSKDTVLADNVQVEIGKTITGWYDARKPMILIYPPQYNVELVTMPSEGTTQKVDYFDETLTSADGMLKLNLQQEGSLKLWDSEGKLYTESLSGKHLLVNYKFSTRSIPAQTVPESIYVVEDQKWLTPAGEIPVLVNGKVVHALSSFVKEDKTVMVPLRATAEALGYEVTWLEESQTVMVGKASLVIGKDAYAFARMAPQSLGAAPELREGRTFVPMEFFGKILPELTSETETETGTEYKTATENTAAKISIQIKNAE
ncbi:copper amine oxidase N-terminal domain-containing protein [Acidaminobacter sp.]|uniref:copper amine oxidase N-terminal domain-containing protein n=1 Tax=Acidaminobacter sp. TaxID=1872102 RepID=UPI0013813A00|nr:copper amine oxidase N-terminal domain-containing protein [Acidaminobacter sp.]MDK9710635.1 copper amine oxidase N-terminal domain-containing protein [Acidaminobacter sp.]MZQ96378.1 hypothetical protein [Acidaminobacter sp.]